MIIFKINLKFGVLRKINLKRNFKMIKKLKTKEVQAKYLIK